MVESIFEIPRYKENPIYLFFEAYILDTIGKRPPEMDLDDMDVAGMFDLKEPMGWKDAVKVVLNLSDTIDTAILDLWYRNRKHYDDPRHFAINFVDEYYRDNSLVDVWPPGALDAAKERIARVQADEGPPVNP